MNRVSSILPIAGVPDELLRVLNERFREMNQETPATVSASAAGLAFAHSSRASANLAAVGTFGAEIDRGVVYQLRTAGSSKVWVYVSGSMTAAFASMPADLGIYDAGFLWNVSDYAHTLRWTGAGWEFVDEMGGYFVHRVVAPDGNGWQLCDGTATHYLHISAGVVSEVAITTPNLTGTPAYLKAGAAYAVTINAATTPTLSGSTATEAAHTHPVTQVIAAVSAGGINIAQAGTPTGAGSAHSHTVGTLAVSVAGGDPIKNVVCLPYFRR